MCTAILQRARRGRAQQLIVTLYEYYLKHVDELPDEVPGDDGASRGRKSGLSVIILPG